MKQVLFTTPAAQVGKLTFPKVTSLGHPVYKRQSWVANPGGESLPLDPSPSWRHHSLPSNHDTCWAPPPPLHGCAHNPVHTPPHPHGGFASSNRTLWRGQLLACRSEYGSRDTSMSEGLPAPWMSTTLQKLSAMSHRRGSES